MSQTEYLRVVDHFVRQIPLTPKPQHGKTPRSSLILQKQRITEKDLQNAYTVFETYMQASILKNQRINGREAFTINILYLIVDECARFLDNNQLLSWFNPFHLFRRLDEESFFFLDGEDEAKKTLIDEYFSDLKGVDLADINTCKEVTGESIMVKSSLLHFYYLVASKNELEAYTKAYWCNNLKEMYDNRGVSRELIDTYLLAKKPELLKKVSPPLYLWVKALWQVQVLLPKGPTITNNQSPLAPTKGYILHSWNGFELHYDDWKNNQTSYFQAFYFEPTTDKIWPPPEDADKSIIESVLLSAFCKAHSETKNETIKEIYWASSFPTLEPYHLFTYFLQHIELLDSITYQQLLYLRIFNKDISMIQKLLTEDSLQKLINALCEKGLTFSEIHLLDEETAIQPRFSIFLFLSRFYNQYRCFSNKEPCALDKRFLKYINLMIDHPTLSPTEKKLAHLHRIDFYRSVFTPINSKADQPSIEPFEQKGGSEEPAQKTEIQQPNCYKEIFQSWFFLKNECLPQQTGRLFFLEQSAESFIFSLITSLKDSTDRSILIQVFKGFTSIEETPTGTEKITSEMTLKISVNQNTYILNLLKGLIIKNDQIVNSTIPEALFTSNNFRTLFQNTKLSFQRIPEDPAYVYFQTESGQQFRFFQKDNDFFFEMSINNNWFQYVPSEQVGYLPYALTHQHFHFISVNSEDESTLFVLNPSFQPVAKLDQDGKMVRCNDQNSLTCEVSEDTLILEGFDFDHPICYLFTYHNSELIRWEISRYASQNKKDLAFIKNEGSWLWEENENFYLCNSTRFSDSVYGVDRYFLLEHSKTSEKKVLLPYNEFDALNTQMFTTKGPLNNLVSVAGYEKGIYFVYGFDDSELHPESLEASLFLAYLDLHYERYSAFLTHLNRLTQVDTLTPLIRSLLKNIINYPNVIPHNYPTVYALVLKAYLSYQSLIPIGPAESSSFSINQALIDDYYSRYLNDITKVDQSFQLKINEELNLISNLDMGDFEVRKVLLEKNQLFYTYHPSEVPDILDTSDGIILNTRFDIEAFVNHQMKQGDYDANAQYDTWDIGILSPGFFNKAWSIILSNNQYRRKKLRFILKIFDGLKRENFVPNTVLDHINPKVLRFYRESLNHFESKYTDPFCYPDAHKQYRNESQTSSSKHLIVDRWVNYLIKQKRNRSLTTQPDCRKSRQISQELQIIDSSTNTNDAIEISIPLDASPFSPILKYFTKVSLVTTFEDFEEVFDFEIPKHLRCYDTAIRNEIDHTKACLKEGKKHLGAKYQYNIEKNATGLCINQLDTILNNLTSTIEDLEFKMKIAAKYCEDDHLLQQNLLEIAKRKSPLSTDQLGALFLLKSRQAFKKANPDLDDEKIESLFLLIGKWNYAVIERQKALHALRHLKEIQELDKSPVLDGSPQEAKRKQLCRKIVSELESFPPEYFQEFTPEALTFARMVHKIPRKDQIEDIRRLNDEKSENCLLQKIMGGGKTSINAAIWAYTCAARGKLPILLVHRSQLSQVKDNIKKSQKTAFGQEVFSIDFRREDLNYSTLSELNHRLEEGLKEKKLLIICPEMLDIIDLQCDLLIIKLLGLDQEESVKDDQSLYNQIQKLYEITDFTSVQSEGLGDEVDLLFSNYQETNIPFGEVKKVPPERVDLGKIIFKSLISETLQYSGHSLRDYIGIIANKQTALIETTYYQYILPLVAQDLIKKNQFPSLKTDELQKSYIDFVSKSSSENEDVVTPFQSHITALYNDKNADLKEEACLICLSKHMLYDLAPRVFKGSAGRHFGRWVDQDQEIKTPFKVIPYLGTDNPALTEIGYHYEAIIKHFVTALQFEISKDQIQFVQEKMMESANRDKVMEEIDMSATADYESFKAITDVSLTEISNPFKLAQAAQTVNSDPLKKLDIEGETANYYATYYPKRLTRRPQGQRNYFHKLHVMGGTPWNHDGYHDSYLKEKNLFLDQSAEGAILQILFNRAKTTQVLLPSELTLEAIFDLLFEKTTKEDQFIGALFDAGAIFSRYSSRAFAETFVAFSKKKGLSFKGCLFFDQSKGKQKDQFSAMLQGFPEPIPIPGTHKKDIEEATKHPIERFFISLGEKQVTGTDLECAPDLFFSWTVDEEILLRTILQTQLRARDLFYGQKGIAILPQHMQSKMIRTKSDNPLANIYATSIVNQGIKKADSLDRSYHNKLDQIFFDYLRVSRQEILKENLSIEQAKKKLGPLYEIFGPVAIQETIDDPFLHFAKREKTKPYINKLNKYSNNLKAQFDEALLNTKKKYNNDKEAQQQITQIENDYKKKILPQIEALLAKAMGSDANKLPSTTVESTSILPYSDKKEAMENFDAEVYQEKYTEQSINQELEQSLHQELNFYKGLLFYGINRETLWQDKDCKLLTEAVYQEILATNIHLLNDHFSNDKYQSDFRFWDCNIFVTTNLKQSLDKATIFHPKAKPSRQILYIKTKHGNHRFILLTSQEGDALKPWLEAFYKQSKSEIQKSIFFIHPSKHLLVSNPHAFLPIDESFHRGLIQINLFGGTLSFIEKHYFAQAESWMEEVANSSSTTTSLRDKKEKFLKMRLEDAPEEKKVLYQTDLIEAASHLFKVQTLAKNSSEVSMKDPELIPKELDPKKINNFTKKEVASITPEQVPHIKSKFYRFLSKDELIQAVPIDRVHLLHGAQISAILPSQVKGVKNFTFYKLLLDKQLAALSPSDFSDDQHLRNFCNQLTHDQLKSIANQDFIPFIPDISLPFLNNALVPHIPTEKYRSLGPTQISSVPENNYQFLTGAQLDCLDDSLISKIQNPDIFNKLTTKLSKINPDLVEKLKPTKLKDLNAASHIQKINMKYIGSLIDTQYIHLSREQLTLLSEKDRLEILQKAPSLLSHYHTLQEKSEIWRLIRCTDGALKTAMIQNL
ncbi:MAG: DUF3638 domain-containing protein, partial [Chlamydiia bacterium]|nr:DUF3638 domain-containing protein [Chlamydiia bacterium]